MKIQLKILLVIIGTLLLILFVTTHYTHKFLERNHESALRDDAAKIIKQVESYIGQDPEAHKADYFEEHITELMFLSSHIVRIDIYSFKQDGSLEHFYTRERTQVERTDVSAEETGFVRQGQVLMNYEQVDGKNYVNVTAPLRPRGELFGMIEFKIAHEEFFNLLAKKRKLTLIVAALAVAAIAGVLIISLDTMVNRPINDLLSAISMVKEGDLSVRVVPYAQDEIGQLASHFNMMMETIAKNASEREDLLKLINRSNDELQQKVDLATVELRQRNEALSHANQAIYDIQKKLGHSRRLAAVGQLAARVAHELGTPLHSISGHMQMMQEEQGLSPDAMRRVSIMQSQIDRITGSIQDLLDTTRPPSTDVGSVSVNKVLEDILILVMPETISKSVTVRTAFGPEVPPVRASVGRLEEVFLNIIDNAIEACSQDGVISISTVFVEEPPFEAAVTGANGWVKIAISDNGRGIPREFLPHIFEPFYTTKTRGYGTGLGLSISKEIIEGYRGRITVESRPGEGSAFTVYLPEAQARS